MIDTHDYGFDPTYKYSLVQLLAVKTPKEPIDFDAFWQHRYQTALNIKPNPHTKIISENTQGWRVFEISYTSTDNYLIHGRLLLPTTGVIKRGFIIGHGYGSSGEPEFHLPFTNAALLFISFRGLALSAHPNISPEPAWHVLHNINQRDRYILGGCVEDVWLGISALLQLFPRLAGHLGFLGISFSGGIGALALAWDKRITRGHLNLPTFGNHPLRLRLPTHGSTHSLQQFYLAHKKLTLKVLRYYDAALAAKRITMPLHCACAVFDPFVAPPAQFSIYNALSGTKELFVLSAGHHQYPEQKQQEQALLAELDTFFAPLND